MNSVTNKEPAGDNMVDDGKVGKKARNQGGRPKGAKSKPKPSAYNPATMTLPSVRNEPGTPLNIWSDESVQEYFPYLYREYTNLSNRMIGILETTSDTIIPKEGYCTKILNANFERQLAPIAADEKDKVPFDNDCNINQFAVFMHNMFRACETGSIGVSDFFVCTQYTIVCFST